MTTPEEQLERLVSTVIEGSKEFLCEHQFLDPACSYCQIRYELRRSEEVIQEVNNEKTE